MAVEGPLQPGDKVVIDGADRLRDGAKVEVIASDPKQRPGADAPRRRPARRRGPAMRRRGDEGRRRRPVAPACRILPAGTACRAPAAPSSPAAAPRPPHLTAAADGNAGERQRRMDRLPPEVAEKLKAMSPEERRAWFQKQREDAGTAGKAVAPPN